MKKLLLKCLLLLPILSGIIGVNFFVDPAHLYTKASYEKMIVDLLLQGNNVANVTNYDERLVQKYYIQGSSEGKDVIVLGSSRSMGIDSNLFPGKTFFNYSVSGATLEDLIGIYQLAIQQGQKPTTVVLGLDPWMLNRNHGQIRWKTLSNEFQAGMRQMNLPLDNAATIEMAQAESNLPARAMELVSPTYFRASLHALLDSLLTGQPDMPYATQSTAANERIKLADGSLSYEEDFRNRSPKLVKQSAQQYVNANSVYSLNEFTQLDPQFEQWLEAFIDRMQAEAVTVIFYLPPYHPYVYDHLIASEQYQIIGTAQTYFSRLASEKRILLLGSYNPQDLGCDETEFYDGMHARPACVVKVFQPLR